MLAYKLQVIGCLLILLAIINTSTTYSIDKTIITPRDPSYPIHNVSNRYRGDLISMQHICLYWISGDYVTRWQECVEDFDGKDYVTVGYSSPWWAAGYYFGAYDEFYRATFSTDYVMWFNDDHGQEYCNDLHYHIKGFKLKQDYNKYEAVAPS
ncbi:27944_t:CDS:1, partial [Racocetra persica]